MMAHSVALAAEAVYESRLLAREYTPTWGSIEYSEDWLSLYRDENRVWQVVSECVFSENHGAEHSESNDGWTELEREWDESQKSFERWQEKFSGRLKGEKLQQAVNEINVWLEANNAIGKRFYTLYGENLLDGICRDNAAIPDEAPPVEVYFLTHVLFPCWFEYQKKPSALLKSAESGHWQSIVKLLRLDKTMLEHPPIMRAYTRSRREKYPKRFEALEGAFNGTPLGPCTKAQVKTVLAAYLLKQFRDYDKFLDELEEKYPLFRFKRARLKIPDLRRLFSAMAMDCHGLLEDPDLAESDNAFGMAVRRALKLLPDEPIVSQNFLG